MQSANLLRALVVHVARLDPANLHHIAHFGSRALRTLTGHIAQSEVHMYVRMFISDSWSFSDFCMILDYALLDSDKLYDICEHRNIMLG